MNPIKLLLCALALMTLVACGDGAIEVVGTYMTPFGVETISETNWNDATIEDWDNDSNWAVTKNPADSMFFADKYAKLVWTDPVGGDFFYCTVEFGQDSLEIARTSTQTADAADPATGGCGGFSWTSMTLQ